MDYRHMNADSLQQGVTEVANRIFRDGLERGRLQGRAEMARELLAALEAADAATPGYNCDEYSNLIVAIVREYRARYPATPAAAAREDGGHDER